MPRSEYPMYSLLREEIATTGGITGAGAVDATILATTKMPVSDNMIASAARTGAGAYTVTLKEIYPRAYPVSTSVVGLDGKSVQITSIPASALAFTIQSRNTAGAATDLAATDDVYIHFKMRKNL
jgi:hypothetical protein